MRVLLLVAIIASLAVTAYGQDRTATARFYGNANCTGSEIATGTYPYTVTAGTGGGSSPTTGNCNAVTGSAAQFVSNATTYISGLSYIPQQTLAGVNLGSWAFNLNSGSNTCSSASLVATAAQLDGTKLDQCTAVTTLSGTGATKWWVKVTSAASTATISAVVGLVAVLASLATSL